jgi:hypothetical protein
MKFTNIDKSITDKQIQLSLNKFREILIELGIRKDNFHIGSGVGGNEDQLIVMMDCSHYLTDKNDTLSFLEGVFIWGNDWLCNSSRKDIRSKIDQVFAGLPEDKNFDFKSMAGSNKPLIQAYTMCERLAAELDAGDKSNIQKVASALLEFDIEIVAIAIRKYISIERIIKFNLDEDPIFGIVCRKIQELI